ncbi:ABC transporter substrate-binding protein [Streptomyces sp. CBMA152]|uniref:ABC transporter substrate-binding protein n=1 Tax=Streptomyces sp. CBMA152 TaxID=1896312 RepID=UPI00166048E7|nr:ABC transporter substrate-binding protein [Streptomyces sp. CBMA152]MBD0744547.1 ABC transporter substrate-binding protein [Streptomyces sp. CBMA152]
MEKPVWQFSDDRGQRATAGRAPARVTAYLQAAATLWDHGVGVEAVFGSFHDGAVPDRAKAGGLPLDRVRYLGAGHALDLDALLQGAPDLVVAVSYGGGQVYGLAPETAKHLEDHVPVVVIDVGHSRDLAEIRSRFTELAHSLGGDHHEVGDRLLDAASRRLRTVTAATRASASTDEPARPRVLALSPAGTDQVHVARPGAWPELRALAEHGVHLVEPPPGGGASWTTLTWAEAAALPADIILSDIRVNATPIEELRADPHWRSIENRSQVLPWNPEAPCSARAHARFFALVADAVAAAVVR